MRKKNNESVRLRGSLATLLKKVRNKTLKGDDFYSNSELEILARIFIDQEINGEDLEVNWEYLHEQFR